MAVEDPLERMRRTLTRRFRWFTVYHATMVVIALALIGWIALPSGSADLVWVFIYVAIVMPVGVPVVWWLNRRNTRRLLGSLEPFRSRITDAKTSLSMGYLLVLDSGVVLGIDPRSNTVRFVAFLSAGGALLRPDLTQAERWGSRIRGMQPGGAVTKKKGPPEAQAELEQLRVSIGARWYMFFLREVRADRLAPGDPMWHAVLGFFIPRWSEHAKEVAGQLEAVTAFLTSAKARYFPHGTGDT